MSTLTVEEVRSALDYDPETGVFVWKWRQDKSLRWNHKHPGNTAGTKDFRGAIRISINKKLYIAHRLAWFVTYGAWPSGELDHINQNPSDNRICNLREVTREHNQQNISCSRKGSKSKVKGVFWDKQRQRWRARIFENGLDHYLGSFTCKLAAKIVYEDARRRLHPGFVGEGMYVRD